MNITFKTIEEKDLPTLYQWLQYPHICRFWDDGDRLLEQVRAHYRQSDVIRRFISLVNEQPAGYIQSYDIDPQHQYAKYCEPRHETIGLDYFIGESQFLGKHLALPILSQFISQHCQNSSQVIVDPEIENEKAIHIYNQYGFKKVGEIIIKDKQHQLMAIHLRRTSRGIVLNSNKEILLIHINDKLLSTNSNDISSFWITVGGRIEKNESAESALMREIREEVGIISSPDLKLIAFGEQILSWKNFPTRFIEKFFLVLTDEIDLKNTALTEEEKTVIKDYRWWSISELQRTHELIFPRCLAHLIDTYVRSNQDWIAKEISLN